MPECNAARNRDLCILIGAVDLIRCNSIKEFLFREEKKQWRNESRSEVLLLPSIISSFVSVNFEKIFFRRPLDRQINIQLLLSQDLLFFHLPQRKNICFSIMFNRDSQINNNNVISFCQSRYTQFQNRLFSRLKLIVMIEEHNFRFPI